MRTIDSNGNTNGDTGTTVNAAEAASQLGVGIDQMRDHLERGMVIGAYKPYAGSPWIIPSPVRLRQRQFVKTAEAAEILGRSRASLAYFRKTDRLPGSRKERVGGQEVWLYDRREVQALRDAIGEPWSHQGRRVEVEPPVSDPKPKEE